MTIKPSAARPGPILDRRTLLRDGVRLLGLTGAAQLGLMPLASRVAEAQPERGTVGLPAAEDVLRARVMMLGTQGGPSVNLRRSQTANAVIVDEVTYLVDCGYGTVRSLVEAGLGYLDVADVFLTHLHDDHTLDVSTLLSLQWTGRRSEPTRVHGPAGTEALVEGALDYLAGNIEIRTVDEGRTVEPAAVFSGRVVTASSAPQVIWEDERVRVSAVENTHFPDEATARMEHRSLAYRFDAAGRSFVFSGDTARSENVIELARDAEIFVCEAMDIAQHERLSEQARAAEEAGDPNAAFLRHVVDTHVTTEQVGRMAAEAGVGTVVLYHLLPGSNGPVAEEVPDTVYIEGVRRHFDGPVIVGRDLMQL